MYHCDPSEDMTDGVQESWIAERMTGRTRAYLPYRQIVRQQAVFANSFTRLNDFVSILQNKSLSDWKQSHLILHKAITFSFQTPLLLHYDNHNNAKHTSE